MTPVQNEKKKTHAEPLDSTRTSQESYIIWFTIHTLLLFTADCIAPDLPPYTIQYPLGGEPSDAQETYAHSDVMIYACAEVVHGTLVGPDAVTCRDGAWDPEGTSTCTGKHNVSHPL